MRYRNVCDRRRERAFVEQVLLFPQECEGGGVLGHSKVSQLNDVVATLGPYSTQ